MTAWETEDEYSGPIMPATLPTPAHSDVPSRKNSRRRAGRRSITPPGRKMSPSLHEKSKRSSRDITTDETISILDPRRFTPTLHANLVSEILTLRRDQEEKIKLIEELETALHLARQDQESLEATVISTSKESRSLKRQLSLLEGGTSSAIGDLAKERDEAVESITDAKKRLEAAQRKIRAQEEDSQRVHSLWAKEKDEWEEERRKFERKVHVAESRLKILLEEVALYQAEQQDGPHGQNTESEADESTDREGDAASIRTRRTMSVSNSIRLSVISNSRGLNSLADELNFGDDDDWQTDYDDRRESMVSINPYRHTRSFSRESTLSVARRHMRTQSIQSIDNIQRPGSVARGSLIPPHSPVPELNEDALSTTGTVTCGDDTASLPEESVADITVLERADSPPLIIKVEYVDSGIQFSPPPSPILDPKFEYVDSGIQFSPPPSPKLEAIPELELESESEPEVEPEVFEPEPEPQPEPKPEYVDSGIQFSPPPSPKLDSIMDQTVSIPAVAVQVQMSRVCVEVPPRISEIEANQRRKRVNIERSLTIEPVAVVAPSPAPVMVSCSSQTVTLPSPPITPTSTIEVVSIAPTPVAKAVKPPKVVKPTMVTSCTQTDPIAEPKPVTVSVPVPVQSVIHVPIPSISIVPPTSRPSSPQEPRLPQYFKDFGCQVNMPAVPMASCSVQTEPIRIDKRLAQLPPHLQPSAIRSRPVSPDDFSLDDPHQFTPAPSYVPPRNPRRLTSQRSVDISSSPPAILLPSEMPIDAYPGNNDDGPLSGDKAPMRRPHRISSLFAGFDGLSSDEEYIDPDSDNEYRTALSAPKPKSSSSSVVRPGKRGSNASIGTSPDQIMRNSSRSSSHTDMFPTYTLTENVEVAAPMRRPSVRGKSIDRHVRGSNMRKATLIQSGIVTHATRPVSPSHGEIRDPPFPIPTRASSRRLPASASAPSDGHRSPVRRGSNRSHYRADSIRKVRSAAALPRGSRGRRDSRSPPPFSIDPPTSPSLPPLSGNELTSPQGSNFRAPSSQYRRHRSQLSSTTANTAVTANTAASDTRSIVSQTTGVVDAIAQTMVGEWMYKYVRRRKSFGVTDTGNREEPSNDRHKRWVWLAPYERAILWSSKQPSTNTILMGGKAGRKLAIQSVLDVKDDNPPPRGATQLFNRSILILTPQRALKFTATSAERHYLWLTALSFLAHSSQSVPENLAPPKSDPVSFEVPQPKGRRNGIRDSIRLTKSRHNLNKAANIPAIPSIPDIPDIDIPDEPSPRVGEVMTFRSGESFSPQPSNVSQHTREQSRDAAEPPLIPRFSDRAGPQAPLHGRKRSNTGGHVPPPLSFRGFSGPAGSSSYHAPNGSVAGASIGTAGSSDIYQQSFTGNSWGGPSPGGNSGRTSEASTRAPNNFFDAIGTVRMEAFISPLAYSQFDDEQAAAAAADPDDFRMAARRRSKELRRQNSRNRHRDSYASRWSGGSRFGGEEDFFASDDPFKGF